MRLQYALKKIIVKLSEEGIPQSVVREISTLMQLRHQSHPNIIKCALSLFVCVCVSRLHDIFHGLLNDREMYLNVVYEKCDWDLYEFLRLIPRDMPDSQIRLLSQQACPLSAASADGCSCSTGSTSCTRIPSCIAISNRRISSSIAIRR
jgi:serine/threonine protein kinase